MKAHLLPWGRAQRSEHGREEGDADWHFEKNILIAVAGKECGKAAAENTSR
jgi:hypothetical protein